MTFPCVYHPGALILDKDKGDDFCFWCDDLQTLHTCIQTFSPWQHKYKKPKQNTKYKKRQNTKKTKYKKRQNTKIPNMIYIYTQTHPTTACSYLTPQARMTFTKLTAFSDLEKVSI